MDELIRIFGFHCQLLNIAIRIDDVVDDTFCSFVFLKVLHQPAVLSQR